MEEELSLRGAARERLRSPARFLVLSGLSFTLNLAVTGALHEGAGLGADASFACALATVFLVNFALMRWYVFPGGSRPVVPQLVGFGEQPIGFLDLAAGLQDLGQAAQGWYVLGPSFQDSAIRFGRLTDTTEVRQCNCPEVIGHDPFCGG